MTPAIVLKRIEQIRIKAIEQRDNESAHALEDGLRHDVLLAIADGRGDPRLLARVALKTSEIKFSRHCG